MKLMASLKISLIDVHATITSAIVRCYVMSVKMTNVSIKHVKNESQISQK